VPTRRRGVLRHATLSPIDDIQLATPYEALHLWTGADDSKNLR